MCINRAPASYGHSIAENEGNLYIFGGFDSNNMIKAECWKLKVVPEELLKKGTSKKLVNKITNNKKRNKGKNKNMAFKFSESESSEEEYTNNDLHPLIRKVSLPKLN